MKPFNEETCSSVARLTEDNSDYGTLGSRYLGIWSCDESSEPYFYLSTYDADRKNKDLYKKIDSCHEDTDGSWNFVYMSYSQVEEKAVAYIHFGNSDKSSMLTWEDVAHNTPVESLRFVVGKYLQYPGFNGYFAGIRLNYSMGAFLDSEDAIEAYKSKTSHPQSFGTIKTGERVVVPVVEDV